MRSISARAVFLHSMIVESPKPNYECDGTDLRTTAVAEIGVIDNLFFVRLPPVSITMPNSIIQVSDEIELSSRQQ